MLRRFVVSVCALPLMLAWAAGTAGAARASGPAPAAVMKRAAAAYGQAMQGIVAYRAQSESAVHATLMNKQSRSESWVILRDGQPVRALVLRLVVDGHEVSEAERQALEDKTNQTYQSGLHFFKAPYDPRYMADYAFAAAEEGGDIAFTSRPRDANHGDGTLTLDGSGQVRRVRYVPCRMEGNAQGRMDLDFGAAGPGGAIALSASKGEFKGSLGPLSGSMTFVQTLERYQRFATLEAAIAKLGRNP